MVKLTNPDGSSFYLNAIHVLSITTSTDKANGATLVLCVEDTTFRVQEDVDAVARVVSSALRSIGR